MKHWEVSGKNVHVAHAFEFSTYNDMISSNVGISDLYKLALVKSNNAMYVLVSPMPDWVPLALYKVSPIILNDIRPNNSYGTFLIKDIWNVLHVDIATDMDNNVSIVDDEFILKQGTYVIDITTRCKEGTLRIFNETSQTSSIVGGNGFLTGLIKSNGTDALEIQQFVEENTSYEPTPDNEAEVYIMCSILKV